jgi:hypothetical protein
LKSLAAEPVAALRPRSKQVALTPKSKKLAGGQPDHAKHKWTLLLAIGDDVHGLTPTHCRSGGVHRGVDGLLSPKQAADHDVPGSDSESTLLSSHDGQYAEPGRRSAQSAYHELVEQLSVQDQVGMDESSTNPYSVKDRVRPHLNRLQCADVMCWGHAVDELADANACWRARLRPSQNGLVPRTLAMGLGSFETSLLALINAARPPGRGLNTT